MYLGKNSKIVMIGGDKRQTYLYEMLCNISENVTPFLVPEVNKNIPYKSAFEHADIILLPVPFSKDSINVYSSTDVNYPLSHLTNLINSHSIIVGGYFNQEFCKFASDHSITLLDVQYYEPFAIKNAIATAEAAIATAISISPQNLQGSHCFITGYGKCAKAIASRLKGFHTKISIYARNPVSLAYACSDGFDAFSITKLPLHIGSCDFIFNTVPSLILTKPLLEQVKKHTAIIDIASGPGGTDFDACKSLGITATLTPSLPGRYSPLSSAKIIYECLEEINET